jgi:ATP-dependent exoDNAse (exonuclease V) beta subunit
MVDEFQDTNEIQFIMVMMLMKTNNLCAVGDWKQGIYAFRNATIDNILEFDEKLRFYKDVLNRDHERIKFDVKAEHSEFDVNYRSSQKILDFSEKSLIIPATNDEKSLIIPVTDDDFIDDNLANRITHLNSAFDLSDKTRIEFFQAKDDDSEYELVLGKIMDIVDNDDYLIKEIKNDEYVTRPVKFKDIAVLCRNRAFGLELQNRAMNLGISANYDGGIELFKTEPALLVLAWLRLVVDVDNPRGWLPILEKEDYNYSQISHIIWNRAYPKNLKAFRDELVKEDKDVVSLIDKILKFHNFSGSYTNAIIVTIQLLFSNFLIPVSELINFIEENIENIENIKSSETYKVDINLSDDAFIIQTIHGAKGLEYPVVFIANVNQRRFPSLQTEKSKMFYHDLIGLRIRDEFGEKNGYKYVFDKWQTDLLTTKLFSDYDEERRLLYVAITRAKQYLIFTSNPNASKFFNQMAEEFNIVKDYEPKLSKINVPRSEIHDELTIGDYEKRGIVLGVHDLMKYKHPENGKGMQFGNDLHSFAQKVALGIDANWDQPEADKIRAFIKSLNADELKTEIECSLPVEKNLIRGEIDLLAMYDDKIEIIDYKSDLDSLNEGEYRKQLSIYYHVLSQVYPQKNIVCKLYYVCLDNIKDIKPLSMEEIKASIKSIKNLDIIKVM